VRTWQGTFKGEVAVLPDEGSVREPPGLPFPTVRAAQTGVSALLYGDETPPAELTGPLLDAMEKRLQRARSHFLGRTGLMKISQNGHI